MIALVCRLETSGHWPLIVFWDGDAFNYERRYALEYEDHIDASGVARIKPGAFIHIGPRFESQPTPS